MVSYPKIVILTSNCLRHKYFANRIVETFGDNVIKIFSEDRSFNPRNVYFGIKDKEILDWYYDWREAMEEKYFLPTSKKFSKENKVIYCPPLGLKSRDVFEKILEINPDIIAVYGTSLISSELIDNFPNKIINIHLGLSPYYRGSGTNFWAFYNNELEYVGATIHFLSPGIDTGNIIYHVRPSIELGDNPHSVGCKVIIAATNKMIEAIEEKIDGKIKSYPQWSAGKLYLRKDFKPEYVRKLKSMLEAGLIENYLKKKDSVYNNFKIIE
jgi:methionyl-tRNA formyltransferase